jgi:hypothetical protein
LGGVVLRFEHTSTLVCNSRESEEQYCTIVEYETRTSCYHECQQSYARRTASQGSNALQGQLWWTDRHASSSPVQARGRRRQDPGRRLSQSLTSLFHHLAYLRSPSFHLLPTLDQLQPDPRDTSTHSARRASTNQANPQRCRQSRSTLTSPSHQANLTALLLRQPRPTPLRRPAQMPA